MIVIAIGVRILLVVLHCIPSMDNVGRGPNKNSPDWLTVFYCYLKYNIAYPYKYILYLPSSSTSWYPAPPLSGLVCSVLVWYNKTFARYEIIIFLKVVMNDDQKTRNMHAWMVNQYTNQTMWIITKLVTIIKETNRPQNEANMVRETSTSIILIYASTPL